MIEQIGGSLLWTQLNPQIAQVRKRCFDKTVQFARESTNSWIKIRRQKDLPSENMLTGSDLLSFKVNFPAPHRAVLKFCTRLCITSPKFNSSPLKMDGWKTSFSFWVWVTFQGKNSLLNFRWVSGFVNSTFPRDSCNYTELWRIFISW